MPPKKDKPPGKDYFGEVMLFLLVILMVGGIVYQFQYLIGEGVGSLWARFILWFVKHFWPIVKLLGTIVVCVCLIGLNHSVRKLSKIVKEEKKIYGKPEGDQEKEESPEAKNLRWETVMKHINSNQSSDWRLAIIEADVMLDELLQKIGLHGESVGERLKAVERSDFLTVDAAWEAHKIRNNIAHAGAEFQLNEREAKRVISLYETVFEEFQII